MFENLKSFFSQRSVASSIAKQDQIRLNIPTEALYVTVSASIVVQQPSQLLRTDTYSHGMLPVTALADKENNTMQVAYMLHDGQNLKLIRDRQTIFSTPLTNITRLHRFVAGGFVLHLSDGRGVALSTPTPVQTVQGMQFKTIHGMTDMTGGWLKELEPYGVQVSD